MKAIKSTIFLVLCTFFYSVVIAQSATRGSFNTNWKFHLGDVKNAYEPGFNDQGWRNLNLPHDWSIELPFDKDSPTGTGGGALRGGIGWYRKVFKIDPPAREKMIYIEFDGVYRNSEVWINGHYLGKRPNGYISFRYELSRYIKYGEDNIIAVKVDNSLQPDSRWYSGSGIYRNVWLDMQHKVHVDHWGTFVRTVSIKPDSATIQVETKIRNDYDENKKVRITTGIYDKDKKLVAITWNEVNAIHGAAIPVIQTIKIAKPHLWSVDDPYLYTVGSMVEVDNLRADIYITTTGIRSFEFDINKGFILNGRPVKIRGVCNHHDLGALGAAINTRALERQLEILKAMGCNGIRTSHNPPAPELLDLCDRMGFIVMDEAFDIWKKQKTAYDYHLDWDEYHYRDLTDQLLRDRNHPSVFMWSVGNEVGEQWGDSSGRTIARELVSIVKAWDSTRPVVTANNEANTWNQVIQSGAFELIGYNYNHPGWEKFHERWPGKKFIVTESVSALETRGHYDKVPFDTIRRWPKRWDLPFNEGNPDFTVSAYDHVSTPWGSTHEETLKIFEKYDHISGMYIWTGFDYLGEPTPYPWPARSSYFGIIDLAGFPKDVYYLYQSLWTNQPVLHIYPHWSHRTPLGNWSNRDTVDVVAYYNNADEVELYLNGRSLGKRKKEGDKLHAKWRVPFKTGTVRAVSRKAGKTVLTKEIKTAGKPAKIILQPDKDTINADGTDLSFVKVIVADKDGVMIPDADHLISFTVEGGGFIAAVDNGSPTSHESFKASQRKAFYGLALAILQSNGEKKDIKLIATSAGLQGASVTISIK